MQEHFADMLTIQDMPTRTRPSDLDATPDAAEEHGRLTSATQAVSKEKTKWVNLKRKAKGRAVLELAQKIGELERVPAYATKSLY